MTKVKRNILLCAGVSLLLLAGILCGILLPRAAAKKEMRALLQAAAAQEVQYLVLTDPHYDSGEFLAGKGKEVTLEGELLSGVRAQLLQLCTDLKYKGSDKVLSGLDLRLFAKSADGSVVQLYFQTDRFYYISKDTTYYFAADAESYAALLATLAAALQ